MFRHTDVDVITRTKILIAIIIVFVTILLFSSIFMLYATINSVTASQKEDSYNTYTNELLDASSYLSNQAYKYVLTGDKVYYDNYIEELEENKRREKAVIELFALGITRQEQDDISKVLEESNYLTEIEMSAFELMDMYKEEEAKALILDDYYQTLKQNIELEYKEFMEKLTYSRELESKHTYEMAILSFVINICVVIVTAIAAIYLLINFYRLRDESDIDQMTRLQNRNRYKEKINAIIKDNANKMGALIFCDIDNLKFINEHYSYKDGDKYIIEVANKLRIFEDNYSVLARPSGDEFVIFIYGFDDLDKMKNYIELKIGEIKSKKFVTSSGIEEKIRFSTGVSTFPLDAVDANHLIRYADFAMNGMKTTSKGELAYFDKVEFDRSIFLISNRGYLDEFLEKELLDFAMQPIVDAKTFEIIAYEALMRPQVDIINTPYLVLQLAKEESKLDKIEKLVMKKVLEKVHINHKKLGNRKVFVNSIADQCLSTEDIEQLYYKYPDEISKLVVEVTEQEYVSESVIKEKIESIRKVGCGIALDDYGAGYSNEFTLLGGLYDIIKIDMNLIRDIDVDLKRQEILKSIIKVSDYSGYKVLAEGVETENEVRVLMDLGVDYFQGYYFGKPNLEIKELSDDVLEKIKGLI